MSVRLLIAVLALAATVVAAEDRGWQRRPGSSKRPVHPFGRVPQFQGDSVQPASTFDYPTRVAHHGPIKAPRKWPVEPAKAKQHYHQDSFQPYYPDGPSVNQYQDDHHRYPDPSIPHFPSPPSFNYDESAENVYPEPPRYNPEPHHYSPEAPVKPNYPPPYPNTYDPVPCPQVYKSATSCRLLKDCSVWFDAIATTSGASCKLPQGHPGACCADIPGNGRGGPLRTVTRDVRIRREIDSYALNFAARAGQFNVRVVEETERQMRANNVTVRRSSAPSNHLRFFFNSMTTVNVSRGALVVIEATRELGKRFELTPEESGFGLTQFSIRSTILNGSCPADPVCDVDTINSPFRTFDGACNNLRRPSWGRAGTQVQRLLPPNYADGVWQPRVAQSGRPLPSARLVSISVVPDIDSPSPTETIWLMQYGQFINHDLTMTPVFRMSNGQDIQCCQESGIPINNTEMIHPACFPIDIPEDDPFYARFRQRCMSFVRSTPAPRLDCNFGYAEQMNQVSHFLDHSNVYGSDVQTARSLRTLTGGALRSTNRRLHGELDLLPADTNSTDDCTLPRNLTGINPPADVRCFRAGGPLKID